MRIFRPVVLLLSGVSVFVAACITAPTPKPKEAENSSTVAGTVAGATFAPVSAVATLVPYFPGGNAAAKTALRVILSDKANSCDTIHTTSATFVEVLLVPPASGIQVGPYPIVDATTSPPTDSQAEASFNQLDGTCQPTLSQVATTGTFTLATGEFSGADLHATGSVDVTFAGGHLTGDFNAIYCPPPGNFVDASGGPDASDALACTP